MAQKRDTHIGRPASCGDTHDNLSDTDTFMFGDRRVRRPGYSKMQRAGPGVFGPPKDRASAIAVLRVAVARGANHIDTSDFHGPYITNQLIRETLHPYPGDLTILTKAGAVRGSDASWLPAQSPADLAKAVHDNVRNLGADGLDAANLRVMGDVHAPSEGLIAEAFTALAGLRRQGLIRHLGLSNVTAAATPLSTSSPKQEPHSSRSSRPAPSRRCSPKSCRMRRGARAPHRCRWH